MNKLFAVLKREYLQAVRRKMFIIMTVLLPFLMAAAFVVPSMVMVRGLGKKHIVIIDGTGQLKTAFERPDESTPTPSPEMNPRQAELPQSLELQYISQANVQDIEAVAKPYLDRLSAEDDAQRLDGVFVIPANAFESDKHPMKYYSRSSADFMTQERLGRMANRSIRSQRLEARGMTAAEIEKLVTNTDVEGVQVSKGGEQTKGGSATLFLGLIFGFLLTMPSFIYGMEVMRGIIQEKNDRVVEVLISSMTPRQLLSGKILGIAAVGLTQISVWLLMIGAVAGFGAATAAQAGIDVSQYLRISTFVYFIVFFVLAYLTNVCVYAVAGSVCNSDREAQQLIGPIGMIMMLPLFLLGPLITNPDSPFFVTLSMLPVFGPVTMFVRTLVAGPPITQILTTLVVSTVTVMVFLWATAKIFRLGILSYGKRPTIPELMRWIRVA
ncbi:MAG TPA: ABC transporter permease [Thermoanaerobaculia bacterium]|nr:ABC transporter permease [Thermoanaerobaculia bacterium]